MRIVRLALRGLWWRRGASVAVLLIASFTCAVAAAGPIYLDAAHDAVLHRALTSAAPGANGGTGVSVTQSVIGTPDVGALVQRVDAALHRGIGRRAYPTTIASLDTSVILPVTATADSAAGTAAQRQPLRASLAFRDGVCAHVVLTAGRCPSEDDPRGVVVGAATATGSAWRVGEPVRVDGLRVGGAVGTVTLHVRGIYRPLAPHGSYWFAEDHGYFPAPSGPDGRADALLVPKALFGSLVAEAGDGVDAHVDLPLRAATVHTADLPALRVLLDRVAKALSGGGAPAAGGGGARAGVTVQTGIAAVLAAASAGAGELALPIEVVIAQLLALGWFVLFIVVSGANEARGGEIALGKLRGLSAPATLAFTLLEVVLLLLLAVPIGTMAGFGVVAGLGRPVLGAGTVVAVSTWAWPAAIAAALGGLVTALAASVAVLRRPVLEQWRRAERRPRGRALLVEAVVIALAVAGVVELRVSGGLTEGTGYLAVLAPGLIAVAGALVTARLLPLLARAAFRPTRASRFIGTFVGVRQYVRRASDGRTFGLLVVAVALAVFSVSSWAVFAQNRHDRAATELGADRVVTLQPRTGVGPDAVSVLARLDPRSRYSTAVFKAPTTVSRTTGVFDSGGPDSTPRLLVVDPAAFGRLAFSRPDFGAAPLSEQMRALQGRVASPPRVTGTQLRLTVRAEISAGGPVQLGVELTDAAGAPVTLRLGQLAGAGSSAASRRYGAATPGCARGCLLRRVYLTRPAEDLTPLIATLTVTEVSVRTPGGWTSALGAVRAAPWTPMNPTPPEQVDPAESVGADPGGLSIRIATSGQPGDGVPGFGAQAAVPARIPALVSTALQPDGPGAALQVSAPQGPSIPLTSARAVAVLPRGGDAGVVVARDWVVAVSPDGYRQFAPDEIWLSPAAPADFPQRLARNGLALTGVQSVSRRERELGRQGPTLAVALLLAGAVIAVALAAAGTVVTLYLLSRRRIYELAAMRTLGIGSARLAGSVLVEQGILVVLAVVTGVLLGVLGAACALPVLPEFVDRPSFPPLVVHQPPRLITVVGLLVVALVMGAIAACSVLLVRAARPARLREAQQ